MTTVKFMNCQIEWNDLSVMMFVASWAMSQHFGRGHFGLQGYFHFFFPISDAPLLCRAVACRTCSPGVPTHSLSVVGHSGWLPVWKRRWSHQSDVEQILPKSCRKRRRLGQRSRKLEQWKAQNQKNVWDSPWVILIFEDIMWEVILVVFCNFELEKETAIWGVGC